MTGGSVQQVMRLPYMFGCSASTVEPCCRPDARLLEKHDDCTFGGVCEKFGIRTGNAASVHMPSSFHHLVH